MYRNQFDETIHYAYGNVTQEVLDQARMCYAKAFLLFSEQHFRESETEAKTPEAETPVPETPEMGPPASAVISTQDELNAIFQQMEDSVEEEDEVDIDRGGTLVSPYAELQPTNGAESVINLLDRALQLFPDFLDAYYLREEVWHKYLKHNDVYHRYLRSKAWKDKTTQVLVRDGYRCVCCNKPSDIASPLEVHHKTYDNIGKEPLSDLSSMCKPCHNFADQQRKKQKAKETTQEANVVPEFVPDNNAPDNTV